MTKQKENSQIIEAIEAIVAQRRIPAATYRLQFNAGFTFNDAKGLLGYLDELGISDLYASPIFLPRMGSTHGYDVADPTRLNSDLGSEEEFDALTRALQTRKIGLLLDIVPNHMGINDPRNSWWLDVLENGQSSDYASFFDIQWHPIKQEMENKVLLPILGDQYGVVLERGELRLNYSMGAFYFTYYETFLPLSPRTYMPILRLVLEGMVEEAKEEVSATPVGVFHNGDAASGAPPNLARLELESIITALTYLPERTESDPERLAERAREKEIIKRRLETLYREHEEVQAALDATVTLINGEVGKPQSFDLLDELIDDQAYRLAFWRVAGEEINYRRFFDINELAAIRVEEPRVFAATHALAFRLLAEGKATGLRIDHPDGLYDPVTYFCRLQQQYLALKVRAELADEAEGGEEQIVAVIDQWLDAQARKRHHAQWPLYVVAEKILSESEPLPSDWAVFGTTGYSFLAAANGIFVDQRNEKSFSRLYSRFSRNRTSLAELTFSTKMMIMRDALAGEISTLAYELERIGERYRHYRDFTLGGLRTALQEIVAALSVYRTYIDAHQESDEKRVSERDRKFVQAAVREAKRRHPLLDDTLFDYIEETLLLRNLEAFGEADRAAIAKWVMKFQQLTGPVMAKGVEDTAFYRYNRLVSLNEVGDHPAQFGISVERFHQENSRRAGYWPHAMLATSTHDNKRSEDVRARINVLAEMPDRWQAALGRFSRLNAGKKRELDGGAAPDANDEYLFYQTLLGAWPMENPRPEHPTLTLPKQGGNRSAATGSDFAGAGENPSLAKRGREQERGDQQVSSQAGSQQDAGVPRMAEDGWGWLLQPADSKEYQLFRQRISNYMLKAVKEAKVYTSWLNPYQEYEEALQRFVDRALQPNARNRFLRELAPLARLVAYYGHLNSLAQTLLKLTAPGVPDIYQGNELWDFSLVDPDNRRSVDYGRRAALLKGLKAASRRKGQGQVRFARELMEGWQDGRIKLFVTQRTLHFRREHYDLFTNGEYIALEVKGERAQHLCAYLRQNEAGEQALVIVPRLMATLTERAERPPVGEEIWGDTAILLPKDDGERRYSNLFTGARSYAVIRDGKPMLFVSELFESFPVALLAAEA